MSLLSFSVCLLFVNLLIYISISEKTRPWGSMDPEIGLASCKTLASRQGRRRARLAQPWFSDNWVAVHATTTTSVNLMGRSTHWNPLTKAERKRVKTGQAHGVAGILGGGATPDRDRRQTNEPVAWNATKRRTPLDSRRPAKSNSSESTLHAILFCVLVGIIVSWALGY